MSVAKRPRSFERPPHPRYARAPIATLLRTVVLAALVVMAAAWALVRHYSLTPAPMLVPVPPTAAPTYDIRAGEIPAPELEPDGS